MSYRQRNISVPTKEEIEVQTDAKLLDSYVSQERSRGELLSSPSRLKLSEVFNKSKILNPFTNQNILKEFAETIKELRSSENMDSKFEKRFQLLEKNIQDLLKRQVLISRVRGQKQEWSNFHQLIDSKEKQIIRYETELAHNQFRITRYESKIKQLEMELNQMKNNISVANTSLEKLGMYEESFVSIASVIKANKNRPKQLQKAVEQILLPMIADFEFNLQSTTKTITREVSQSLRGITTLYAKELDKMVKESQVTDTNISDSITSLYNNLKVLKGNDYFRSQVESGWRASEMEEKYARLVGIFKSEIEEIKKDNPQIKYLHKTESIIEEVEREVDILQVDKTSIVVRSLHKVTQVETETKQIRQTLSILATEFQKLYQTYPEVKNSISTQLSQLFETKVIEELISTGSLERLKQIVVQKTELVKVNNVFTYENSKDKEKVYHLRILIKCLLEEMERLSKKHEIQIGLDEAILCLLRENCLDGIEIEAFIGLFRPSSKIVEAPIILEKPIYETRTFEKSVPIKIQKSVMINQQKTTAVEINRQVPVFIEKEVSHVIANNIAVQVETQKAVPIQVLKDVIVQRIVEKSTEEAVIREKVVEVCEREEVVVEVPTDKIIETVQEIQVEKIVETAGKEFIEVERLVQKPVYIYETKETIKEVEIKTPYIVEKPEYKEIEKAVPYVIQKKQVIVVQKEIAVEIKVPNFTTVEVVEFRDRPIITNEVREVVKEITVVEQRELIKEVPKEIFIERTHFVKGDTIETIKEIQVFVDKPIIQEALVTKDTEVDKIVPFYITEQLPIITEVAVPYITEKIKEIQIEKVKLVPVKEELVKVIEIEKPVPVVVEKEVVRVEIQYVDRIIEKIVEVPRVVEVEKIVEKIVVVPRIIEKIVEVPKIVEKVIIVEKPILQIVEIQVPQIILQEVEKPIEIVVEKNIIEYIKQIETVEIEKIVQRVIEKDREITVEVERRIPIEIVKEIPIEVFRDRVEYQKVEVHEVKAQIVQVPVPITVQEKVPMIVEKPIRLETIIEEVKIVQTLREKEKIVVQEIQVLKPIEVIIEKEIITEVMVEVPGKETIQYIYEEKILEVIKEKIIEVMNRVEIPKQVYLQTEKIVHEIHDRICEIPINKIVHSPQLMEVSKPVNLVHYKEVAVEVPVIQEKLKRDILEQVKIVDRDVEKIVEVEVCKEKIKEVITQNKEYLIKEIVKELEVQIAVNSPIQTNVVEILGQTILHENTCQVRTVETKENIIQKVVEKIVMMPQIVEVVRNIYHISETKNLGVAFDVNIHKHTENYVGVSSELKASLQQLLKTFNANVGRQPDLKNMIVIIEKYMKYIEEWIKFPKIVEVPKEVQKIVEKEKVVLIPTEDKEKISTMSFIIQKLLAELVRVKDSHKIQIQLDEEIYRTFFSDRKVDQNLEEKYSQMSAHLKEKYSKFGQWNQSSPFMMNAFLENHFALRSLVEDSNANQESYILENERLRKESQLSTNKYNSLYIFNRKLYEDYSDLIQTLKKYKQSIEDEDYKEKVKIHEEFCTGIRSDQREVYMQIIKKSHKQEAEIREEEYSSETHKIESVGYYVDKLSKYQMFSEQIESKNKHYQNEVQNMSEEIRIKDSIIGKLEKDFDSKMVSVRQQFAKNPNLNKELLEENKKFQDKSRTLERELDSERRKTEKIKRQQDAAVEKMKNDNNRETTRKEKQQKQFQIKIKRQTDREISKLRSQFDRIKGQKEKIDSEFSESKRKYNEELKNIREKQIGSATDKQNQLLNQNISLRKSIEEIQREYDVLKKAASNNNSVNEKQLLKLRNQNERLNNEKRQWQSKQKVVTTLGSHQQSQITAKLQSFEVKNQELELELQRITKKEVTSTQDIKSYKDKIKKLEIQLDIAKKQVELHSKSKLESTTFRSSYKVSSSIGPEGQSLKSPKGSTGLYKSGFQKSPQLSEQSQDRSEGRYSQSSRISKSSEQPYLPHYYKTQMTLREFMEAKNADEKERDSYITFIMIRIIEKVEEQAENGIFNSYSPNNIYLSNFNPKHLDKIIIKFGAPIVNKKHKRDGIYLAPEVHAGEQPTKKSVVFSLGSILDEVIHNETFFKSIEEVQNPHCQFKVRGEKLNPILKNSLFEMMSKDTFRRLELSEAKRRLSLQKYIATESKTSITSSSRVYKKEE